MSPFAVIRQDEGVTLILTRADADRVRFEPVLPLRAQITPRQPPTAGQWTQWEGIWRAIG